MTSRVPSATVNEVNLAFLKALGLSAEERIHSVDIHLSPLELPTMTVQRYVPLSQELVTEVKKLRLREVTGDGM